MFNNFNPPVPELGAMWLWLTVAALVVLGVPLLLWGRILGRAFVMVAFGVAGMLLGGTLAEALGLPAVAGGVWNLALAFVMVVIGFAAERLIWGLLAAVLLAAPALHFAIFRSNPPSASIVPTSTTKAATQAASSLSAYLVDWWQGCVSVFTGAWKEQATTLLVTLCVVTAIPLLLGLLRPRLIRIVMTSLLGAAGLVGGAILGLSQVLDWLWGWTWSTVHIPLAIVGVLMLAGIIYQYVKALAHDRQEQRRQEDATKAKQDRARVEDAEARRLSRPE